MIDEIDLFEINRFIRFYEMQYDFLIMQFTANYSKCIGEFTIKEKGKYNNGYYKINLISTQHVIQKINHYIIDFLAHRSV